jgi:type IV secretory pathway TraG/TraD family ATPase VirD4
LGQVSAYAHSVSRGQDGARSSEGRSERPVPLLVAQETLQLPAGEVLLFHRDRPPARQQRADWRTVPGLRARHGLSTPPIPELPALPALGQSPAAAEQPVPAAAPASPEPPRREPPDGPLQLDLETTW